MNEASWQDFLKSLPTTRRALLWEAEPSLEGRVLVLRFRKPFLHQRALELLGEISEAARSHLGVEEVRVVLEERGAPAGPKPRPKPSQGRPKGKESPSQEAPAARPSGERPRPSRRRGPDLAAIEKLYGRETAERLRWLARKLKARLVSFRPARSPEEEGPEGVPGIEEPAPEA